MGLSCWRMGLSPWCIRLFSWPRKSRETYWNTASRMKIVQLLYSRMVVENNIATNVISHNSGLCLQLNNVKFKTVECSWTTHVCPRGLFALWHFLCCDFDGINIVDDLKHVTSRGSLFSVLSHRRENAVQKMCLFLNFFQRVYSRQVRRCGRVSFCQYLWKSYGSTASSTPGYDLGVWWSWTRSWANCCWGGIPLSN